ncbi:hypothetical protein CROQUDRAFT_43713 [Cronartium quercuum f. sp. fusiforme G11]|uniref:Uncharacterized protein n=1 Tax=Cronartium quercuum f. sp. fusiforme G11 TaxID=708437 RepID=A0A9P6NMG1_9BASI|nr:hypothetical protein CROQUDRAFT_43713 [Cronartium quercuum f. sp. fusiforme G11]
MFFKHPDFQFIRASKPISRLEVLSTMRASPDGLERMLRVAQYSLRLCYYLYARARPSVRKGRTGMNRNILIISLISTSRKLLHLLWTLRFILGLQTWTLPDLPDDERGRLKALASITSDTTEGIVGLLDDLSLVRLLPSQCNRIASTINLIGVLSRWAETTLAKASLWAHGRATRQAMILRDEPGGRALPPCPEISQAEWDSLPLSRRVSLERSVNRSRRETLHECRRAIDRLWWSRVALVCDGVFSLYDVLEMQSRGEGVRVVAGCASAWIRYAIFQIIYWMDLSTT